MNDRNVSNQIFDVLFVQAVIDNYEEEILAMPSEKELSELYSYSDTHVARMKRLFLQAEITERLHVVAKWAKRCVAVIIVGFVVMLGAFMTVPEVRATVKGVVIEWYEQFTKFTSYQNTVKELQEWEPSYIPEGFAQEDRYGDFGRLSIWYSDSNGNTIAFTHTDQSDSASIDNEYRGFYEVKILDTIYYVFEAETSDKGNLVIWDRMGYRFSIEGQLSVRELLSIAKSVEKKSEKI